MFKSITMIRKLSKVYTVNLFTVCMALIILTSSSKSTGEIQFSIIPQPVEVNEGRGAFRVTGNTVISGDLKDVGLKLVMGHLSSIFEKSAGLSLQMSKSPKNNSFVFEKDTSLRNEEAYRIKVSKKTVKISYSHPRGAFYAVQTIRQLLPAGVEFTGGLKVQDLIIPACEIYDEPRFPYRGMHLDVARHFFDVDFVKKYIDLMAFYKMNNFHWHLTEDQGWRIEIKKYPELTRVGAFRKETLVGHYSAQPHEFDGRKYGGYYTREEIREVVKYAADRFINVIPEIEMPGHSLAALASYPWLGCSPDKKYEVATLWGVFDDVYCPKEETFEFLENVLLEVMDLFPSEYIHIGGDECPKTSWKECAHCQSLIREKGLKDEHELQSYFISRMEKFLNSHGKQIIGWDEILEGGLAPNATVMSWRGERGGIEAAQMGHDAIMTPVSHCYFDYYQSKNPGEPVAIGGFAPVEKVYHYDPVPKELDQEKVHHILGAQGNVWTEYMKTGKHVEYMILPRMPALSEAVWTPLHLKDYQSFISRAKKHADRYRYMNLNFATHIFEE
jgi:hexosaminidase